MYYEKLAGAAPALVRLRHFLPRRRHRRVSPGRIIWCSAALLLVSSCCGENPHRMSALCAVQSRSRIRALPDTLSQGRRGAIARGATRGLALDQGPRRRPRPGSPLTLHHPADGDASSPSMSCPIISLQYLTRVSRDLPQDRSGRCRLRSLRRPAAIRGVGALRSLGPRLRQGPLLRGRRPRRLAPAGRSLRGRPRPRAGLSRPTRDEKARPPTEFDRSRRDADVGFAQACEAYGFTFHRAGLRCHVRKESSGHDISAPTRDRADAAGEHREAVLPHPLEDPAVIRLAGHAGADPAVLRPVRHTPFRHQGERRRGGRELRAPARTRVVRMPNISPWMVGRPSIASRYCPWNSVTR